MSRLPLAMLAGLLLQVACAHAPAPPPRRALDLGRAIFLGNAYRDTVWFADDRIWFVKDLHSDPYYSVAAYGSSGGGLLAIVTPHRRPAVAVRAILDSFVVNRGPGARRHYPFLPNDSRMTVREPGESECPANAPRRQFGWTLSQPADKRSPARITFVAFGPADTPGVVLQWTRPPRLRIYDASDSDLRTTLRVVGEVVLDCRRQTVRPLPSR